MKKLFTLLLIFWASFTIVKGQNINLGAPTFDAVLLEARLNLNPQVTKSISLSTSSVSIVDGVVDWVQGDNQLTLCIDVKKDIALIKVENSKGTFTLVLPQLRNRLHQMGQDPNKLSIVNLLEIQVENGRNKYGAVFHFDAPELTGAPFDTSLDGTVGQKNTYNLNRFCLGDGIFEFKGNLKITNPLEDYHDNVGLKNQLVFRLGYETQAFTCPLMVANEAEELPNGLQISAAYPNPFSATTAVEIAATLDTAIKVNVYNVLGQLVTPLFDGNISAGETKKLSFENKVGAKGVYFIRIEGLGFAKTVRVVAV